MRVCCGGLTPAVFTRCSAAVVGALLMVQSAAYGITATQTVTQLRTVTPSTTPTATNPPGCCAGCGATSFPECQRLCNGWRDDPCSCGGQCSPTARAGDGDSCAIQPNASPLSLAPLWMLALALAVLRRCRH